MIVVLTEMRFAEESDEALRALVPGVERFCRQFEGCERFDISLPPNRPGIVLTTEVWRRYRGRAIWCKAGARARNDTRIEAHIWRSVVVGRDRRRAHPAHENSTKVPTMRNDFIGPRPP